MGRRSASNVVAVVPARYGSSRLPGKPLLAATGRPLIQHVVERASRVFPRVIVATDDRRILEAVRRFGGEAVMTSPRHDSGTSRAAEVVARLKCRRVVNVQGDEPEADPSHLLRVARLLDEAPMTTLAVPFARPEDADRPERVKVVLDRRGFALYFSRSRIPDGGLALLHLGVYGYSRRFLLQFARLRPTPLERAERLEQLRALEHGHRIRVGVVSGVPHGGIDTPQDYRAFVARWRAAAGGRGHRGRTA